jgi:hypothetical protein
MEEDNVTDDGAEAGHQALNAAVQSAIDRVLQSLGATHQVITPEDIASVTEGIDDAVSDAISAEQGVFANIWSWLNADDQIGNQTFVFNQDQFVTRAQPNQRVGTLGISQRWRNQGDWEIFGAMALTETCLASSTASILAGKGSGLDYRGASPDKFDRQLTAMRAFRNRYFHRYEGLHGWWTLAARNTAQLGYLTMRDPGMRKSAAVLLKGIAAVVEDLDAPLSKDFLDQAQRAAGIASKSGFRRLRMDASQAEAALRKLKRGATGQDALKHFSKLSPGRYPKKTTRSAA